MQYLESLFDTVQSIELDTPTFFKDLPGGPARLLLPHCASVEMLVFGVGLGEPVSLLGLGPVFLVSRFELVAVQVR